MGPRELEPTASLHGREKLHAGASGHDALDEAKIRRVVLDIQHRSRHDLRVGAGRTRLMHDRLMRRRLGKRQLQRERRAGAGRALGPQRAAHEFDQALRQRQAESGALDRSFRHVEAIERREEPVHPLRGDAGARVGHGQTASARRGRVARDGHRALRAVVLDRVGEKVQQHLLQSLTIGHDVPVPPDGLREADAAGGRLGPDEIERAPDDLAGLDRLERDREFPGLDARDVEDLVDEPQQMPTSFEDVRDAVALLRRLDVELQELGEAEDAVERCPKLVAHARQEFALGPVGGGGGFLGALRALTFSPLAVVRLDQPRVEHPVLEQQHHEHEAGRQEPVDPAGVEAEVETAGVQHDGQADVEEPRAQHDHQPHVENRVRPAPPEDAEGEEAEAPDERDDRGHRRCVVVVPHDRGQPALAGGRQERERAGDDQRRRGATEDRKDGPARLTASLDVRTLQ